MKNLLTRIVALIFAGSLAAQPVATNPAATADLLAVPNATAGPAVAGNAAPAADAAAAGQDAAFTPAQLNDLLGPIALYPDALIAIILPASTEPADIVLAARFVADKGDPAQIGVQPWDDSVKALAHYPDVVTWMSDNLSWTKTLGDAFVRQPADVMKSVQQLRSQAKAVGTLTDTPEQKVVTQDQRIIIEPAQPNVIYVPQYDPQVVYVQQPVYVVNPAPIITFGYGYPVGPWLGFQCNWFNFGIWVGPYSPGVWYYPQSYWVGPAVVVVGGGRPWHSWAPPRQVVVVVNQRYAGHQGPVAVPRPRGFAGAPAGARERAGQPGAPRPLGPASREGSAPAYSANRPGEAPRPSAANESRGTANQPGEAPRPVAANEPRGAASAPRSPAPGIDRNAMPMPRSPAPEVAGRGPEAPGRGPEAAGHAPEAASRAPEVGSRGPVASATGVPQPRSPAPTYAAESSSPGVSRTYAPVSGGSAPAASRSYTPVSAPSPAPSVSRSYPSGPGNHAPSSVNTYTAPAPRAAPAPVMSRAPAAAPEMRAPAYAPSGGIGAGARPAAPAEASGMGADGRRAGP